MIFGRISIDANAVNTHRDSYLLEFLSVVSTRRPFLGGGFLIGGGLGAFGIAFSDLLYVHEQLVLATLCLSVVSAGFWLGQLKLLSRDLRGSELSGAIWGSYGRLNQERRRIVARLNQNRGVIS